MERQVILRDGIDNDPEDINRLQGFVRDSVDHLVGDGITDERKFAGFATVATGVATATVQPGRLYSSGRVYPRSTVFEKDFTSALPVGAKKIALIVVAADEVETDAVARQFLINAETNEAQPQTVTMERARIANLSIAYGQENADPLPPLVDVALLVVATIVLGTAGIISITMNDENKLDSVESVSERTETLEVFQRKAEPQIASLGSDLAALTEGQANSATLDMLSQVLARLELLEAHATIPSNAIVSSNDFFLDLGHSDTAFAGYSARVEEGLRFPPDASATTELAIANPLNAAVKLQGGVMFPAFTRKKLLTSGVRSGEIQVSTYDFETHTCVQKKPSRRRVRFGSAREASTSSTWWKSGRYDASTGVFRIGAEAWFIDPKDYAKAIRNHRHIRLKQYFEDFYEDPYWDAVTVEHEIQGTQAARVFLQANDRWLDAIGLWFTRLAANGTVTVQICETDRGLPVTDRVISSVTVDRADLKLNEETLLPIEPVFLTGGKRYAIVVMTSADHWVASVQGTSGSFFYKLNSAWQQEGGNKDLYFSLYGMEFASSRVVVDMEPLQLAGGIGDIDILAPAIVPGSSQLSYQVQISGDWVPLAQAEDLILGAGGVLPALLPLQVVFTGTTDVMPALTYEDSQVKVSRAAVAITHIATVENIGGAGSTSIRVVARLEGFDPAHHAAAAKLLSGAGYATETAHSSVSDAVTEDGAILRTWVYTLGGAITSYRVKLLGTTDDALIPFHLAFRKSYAL